MVRMGLREGVSWQAPGSSVGFLSDAIKRYGGKRRKSDLWMGGSWG